jgi:glycosyltransferase involved in cell wall biosynthesis
MEAMAQAKPMIVTDMGGMPDLVDHEETGLVVPPGDVGALVDALTTLVGSSSLRQRMATASLAKLDQFKATPIVARIEEVYRQLVSRDLAGHRTGDARAVA